MSMLTLSTNQLVFATAKLFVFVYSDKKKKTDVDLNMKLKVKKLILSVIIFPSQLFIHFCVYIISMCALYNY